MKKRFHREEKNRQSSDSIKIEVRDVTYRLIFRGTYNLNDANAVFNLLRIIEKFSPYTILELIRRNKWF